ncbi:MAG: BREX system P-loop protein BrxC, partial [Spirochaetaceae bacterium]
ATQIAMKMYPEVFPDERSFQNLKIDARISEQDQVREMLDLITRRSGREKVLFIIDEAGQYVASNDTLVLNLQGFAQNLKAVGRGRAWVIATAQQTLTDDVGVMNSPKLFKLKDRFPITIELKADDIKEITHRRLLSKKPAAKAELEALFDAHGSRLNVLTRLEKVRGYATSVDRQGFVELYPFLPQHFDLMMNIIARLARSTGGTGLRSAIKVVQETLVSAGSGRVFSQEPLGTLVTVVNFFDVLRQDLDNGLAFRHTVEAVHKTEQRFGKDSTETLVAKAVAVMQVLDDFPLSRKNLTALLVDRVEAQDQTAKIEAAIDELQKDTTIPLEEVEGSLRFLSDRAAEMQRNWHTLQPTSHDQRQVVSEVITNDILPSQPKATIFANKQVKAGISLRFGDYPTTISTSSDGLTVDLRFVDPSRFDNERTDAINASTAPSAAKLIVVLAALDGTVGDAVRDVYASARMIRDLRSKTRDADEEEFYRSLAEREKHARARITDAIKIAAASATLVYRGRDVAVQGAASSFNSALETAVSALGKEVYRGYEHAAVTVDTSAAEKMVKARNASALTAADDPLNLLTGGSGGAFNEAHPAVIDVTDYLKRHGTVEGKALLDDFARDPFGWSKDVTRYVVAAMFTAGRVALRINSKLETTGSPTVYEAFKSNVTFSKTGLSSPPSPPSTDILKRAKDRLVELTGESITPIAKNIESTAREALPHLQNSARSVVARLSSLELAATRWADELSTEIDGYLRSDQSGLIRALGDPDNDFTGRLQKLRTLQQMVTGPFGNIVETGRRLIETIKGLPTTGGLNELRASVADSCTELEAVYQDADLESQQVRIQELVHTLTVAVNAAVNTERAELETDVEAFVRGVEGCSDWGDLDEQHRASTAEKLDQIRGLLPSVSAGSEGVEAGIGGIIHARYSFSRLKEQVEKYVQTQAEAARGSRDIRTKSVPGGSIPAREASEALRAIAAQLDDEPAQVRVRFIISE